MTGPVTLRAALGLVVLSGFMLGLTACDGQADDWIVIHANRQTDGKVPAGRELAYLPQGMVVDTGQKLGFVNYYRDDKGGKAIVVKLDPGVFNPSKFTLAYMGSMVVKVTQEPTVMSQAIFELEAVSGDHGGPIILPKKP